MLPRNNNTNEHLQTKQLFSWIEREIDTLTNTCVESNHLNVITTASLISFNSVKYEKFNLI